MSLTIGLLMILTGLAIMAFGLYMQNRVSRQPPEEEHDTYKITED